MSYALEDGGRHGGWEVWALVRQQIDSRAGYGLHAVTARREPLAILLRRAGQTRAFALAPDARDPEMLAACIRAAS